MRTRCLMLASFCCSAYAISSETHSNTRAHARKAVHSVQRRAIVTDADVQDAYDFIIVGGGTAGLTIASRLSEVSENNVLVLEAGGNGDAMRTQIDTPDDAFYTGFAGSPLDWSFSTTPQTSAVGRNISWPCGKVIGGSSAINALYSIRASRLEHDAWVGLLEDADGANAWNWENQLKRYKGTETFTAPDSALASSFDLQHNGDVHGTGGPINVSWPSFQLPAVGNWTSTLAAAGIPANSDPYNGLNAGGFIAMSTVNPNNHTRSYARSAYIDPLPPRSNLAILPNATVTKIIFSDSDSDSSNVTATGVTFQLSGANTTRTVFVNREVILAGGVVGSPHVLMLSGIGPSDVLSAAGVDVLLNLPGVGQHLQDHVLASISWNTTAETIASIRDSGNTDPAFLSYVNNGVAYVSLRTLFGNDQAETHQREVSSSIEGNADTQVSGSDDTVKEGYKAIQHNIADTFMLSELGHVELLLSAQGQRGSPNQTISIQCALQRPLSQGRLYITTSDPLTPPAIDPLYLSHSFDLTTMREGLKLVRRVGQTAPLSNYLIGETFPGPNISSDADWESWIQAHVSSQFHPAKTCSMLPLSKGGVVDPRLKVYGTSNVRVADASVFPVQFASHLMMSVYALAETAAEIVKAEWNDGRFPEDSGAMRLTTPAPSLGLLLALSALSIVLTLYSPHWLFSF